MARDIDMVANGLQREIVKTIKAYVPEEMEVNFKITLRNPDSKEIVISC